LQLCASLRPLSSSNRSCWRPIPPSSPSRATPRFAPPPPSALRRNISLRGALPVGLRSRRRPVVVTSAAAAEGNSGPTGRRRSPRYGDARSSENLDPQEASGTGSVPTPPAAAQPPESEPPRPEQQQRRQRDQPSQNSGVQYNILILYHTISFCKCQGL
jgi:hypothetical protein